MQSDVSQFWQDEKRKGTSHHRCWATEFSAVVCDRVLCSFLPVLLWCGYGGRRPNSRKPPLPPKIPKPRLSCVQRCVPVRPCESIPLLRRMAQKANALGGRSGIAESAQHKRSNHLLPGSSRCWHTASSKGPCPLVPTVQQS